MGDAYTNILKRTTEPLPQQLQELRQRAEEAKKQCQGAEPNSFHYTHWNERCRNIEEVIRSANALPSFGRTAVELAVPVVDEAYVANLISQSESEILDFKRAWPGDVVRDKNARAEVLKDIQAIANTTQSQIGHLVYGVQNDRTICGLPNSVDDADVQQWAKNMIAPAMQFTVLNIALGAKTVCVIAIRPAEKRPHVAIQTPSREGSLHEGQVWFRESSKNTVAGFDDLYRLFHEEVSAELRFETERSSGYVQLRDWFQSLGRELLLGRSTQRDELCGRGYEVARHPLTSREILIGSDAMLFLKPVSTIRG